MIVLTKYCIKCGKTKPATEFGKHKNRYDGLQVWCKWCTSEYHRSRYADLEFRERQAAYLREYYIENSSEILEHQKQYYEENKESRLKYSKQYYKNNVDKVRDRNKKYYTKYQEKKRAYNKRYHTEHPEKSREKIRRRNSRKKELPYDFTSADERFAFEYWGKKCAICGNLLDLSPATRGHAKWALDHWIAQSDKREDNPGTVPWNMLPVCHGTGSCNLAKTTKDPIQWLYKRYQKEEADRILENIQLYFSVVKEVRESNLEVVYQKVSK